MTVELGAGGRTGALAFEALGVLLSPAESRQVMPLLHPGLAGSARLGQLRAAAPVDDGPSDLVGWLRDIVEDADGLWRSTWLRACAIHAANGRGVLDRFDVTAARGLGDPVIDEVLGAAGLEPPRQRRASRRG